MELEQEQIEFIEAIQSSEYSKVEEMIQQINPDFCDESYVCLFKFLLF
jgi:hypothetical protein